jgi:hypothetical protein
MSLQNIRLVGGSRERRPQTIALSSPISSAERRFVAKQQYIFSAPAKKEHRRGVLFLFTFSKKYAIL